jgi:hypothetical protein
VPGNFRRAEHMVLCPSEQAEPCYRALRRFFFHCAFMSAPRRFAQHSGRQLPRELNVRFRPPGVSLSAIPQELGMHAERFWRQAFTVVFRSE